ncbi:MAG: hypothetical protein KF764_04115 [Labilithrix sp.]|nr:hypothetical protein [Labilithrix sp.]
MKSPPRHPLGLYALTGALVLGGGSLLAGSGCSTATSDAASDDAGVFEARETGSATCGACVADACTAAWATCLTDEACLAVRRCAAADGCDGACAATCACSGEADGGARYRAFAACSDARTCGDGCATDCAARCTGGPPSIAAPAPCDDADGDAGAGSASDGGEAAPPTAPTAESCASCAASKCGDAKRACAIGSECASFLACVFECADEACADGCGRLHATGKVAAVELATCTQAGCESECGL